MLARNPLSFDQKRILIGYQQSWHGKNRKVAKARTARKLKQEHRRKLINGTVAILRRGDPTPYAFESFLRHGIRSGLCLRGWTWTDADEAANDVVQAALRQIGARRPTWDQGQPEYVQFGVVMFERTRCARCGWKLPEGYKKFCSPFCFSAHHNEIYRRRRADEFAALEAENAA